VAKNGIHRICLMTQLSKQYRIQYLRTYKTTIFLIHHLKKNSHFIIVHKVKHVVCTYFSENWRLRRSGTIYIVSCYIQVNIASIDIWSMLCKLLWNPNKSTNQMQQFPKFIYLTFMYRLTCFGRPHAHHQELNSCSSSLRFYHWSVVVAVLLVVVGPVYIQ